MFMNESDIHFGRLNKDDKPDVDWEYKLQQMGTVNNYDSSIL